MWDARISSDMEHITLTCNNLNSNLQSASDLEYVNLILKRTTHSKLDPIEIKIRVKAKHLRTVTRTIRKPFAKFRSSKGISNFTIAADSQYFVISFLIDSFKDNFLFDNTLKTLEQLLPSFETIQEHIPRFLNPDKATVQQMLKPELGSLRKDFERSAENNQNKFVFLSARQSEARLRERYNFGTSIYNMFGSILSYGNSEEALIDDLIDTLSNMQQEYLNTKFLTYNDKDDTIWLSKYSIDLLKNQTEKNVEDVAKAKAALDVKTALEAVQTNGSHSSNSGMEHTQIRGYGLYNLVALLWKCCKDANDSSNGFMKGVSFADATKALIHGIANGARGNNRNYDKGQDEDEYEDDLGYFDYPCCDQGCYNFLFAAMLGIFPEVEIKFDLNETFVAYLKPEIICILLSYSPNLEVAKDYIKTWNGVANQKKTPGFNVFESAVLLKLPNLKASFLAEYCKGYEELICYIEDDLERIFYTTHQATGLSYLEVITLSEEDLVNEWKKGHPVQHVKSDKRIRLHA